MAETWKDLPGYEGYYQVSDHGRVKSLARYNETHGRKSDIILRPYLAGKGKYEYVGLSSCGQCKKYAVHKLVAICFIGPIANGLEVNHIDGNKLNNHASNLEIVSRIENVRHAISLNLHAYGSAIGTSKLTEEQVRFIKSNYKFRHPDYNGQALGDIFGVTQSAISNIVNGKKWRHIK